MKENKESPHSVRILCPRCQTASERVKVPHVGIHKSDPPQPYTNCPQCAQLLYQCPHCGVFVGQENDPSTHLLYCPACEKPWEDEPLGALVGA
ncbi:MAG: hypothetical protein KGI73_04350 [Patescibacteria group bacterium]|nr:hypothetical protein [Patescibacteria group bacterium]